ncbi:isoleucine--tRNA ligase [Engelhardtia mirabilis]|uniref:Isoleucine--tRNA ligase n=1 Tax=Engelhardtia mirabilis TaxID=2528011 RepID=A0A518BLN8_9BACT|nr:Isoleucine--tRNA ligase [Planctomycetes bacterium Pla133]QDV02213.1 Isoleucine--tRNA ligase [Planctomycetes bacterium Pla86]
MSEPDSNAPATPYPKVDSQADFPAIEKRVLERWKRDRTFEASVENRPAGERGQNEFVFYDGPPFANGMPHFGHLLTSYAKDVVPRYQTMRGRRVERRFGWDCHGLPAEMHAEKQLGVSGRQAILEYGIDRFNAFCRESVLTYTQEWRDYVARAGRWVSFDNEYRTMDLSYMESVLWAFKQLYDKGLVYEGHRVLPYSWAAETPVSNFETRMDNSYRERDDPALTVLFPLEVRDGDPGPLNLLVWTTTPWTLPSNLAAAVGPQIEYAILEVERDGAKQLVVIGAAARAKYAKELGEAREVGTLTGAELVGRAYTPPFDYFVGREKCHVILGAEFVDTEEGTGVVHLAPGFGEDDQRVCEEHGIELVCPVDEKGRFTAEVADYVGQNVLAANKPIAQDLKARGLVLRHEQYRHNYPHCWRTDEPLIYRAMSSWYVRVTDFRERMVQLNQEIHWIPEHIRDGQFGRWLEGARDWSISRNRFFGTPIPIWRSDDPTYPRVDVYGSIAELEADFGVKITDLHRPMIDELTRPNPDDPSGKSTMRRVEDVLDVWFDSGSMPFAQVHYPFENKEWFEDHFPADFICEYVAQTRGWFYTLVVLATALFDRPPFKNVICHGIVVAEDGRKLSKRLKNYPDLEASYDKYGSDALRWHLMSSPVLRGGDLAISQTGDEFADVVRLALLPIWSAYSFFTMYANADGVRAVERANQEGTLDRYALIKLRDLIESVESCMDAYDIAGACDRVRSFMDALNNWYIRRSRPRFWASNPSQEKQDAYDTLYTCLINLCRVAAPLLPFLTDEIHRGLCRGESVHLEDWPSASQLPDDFEFMHDMDRVRVACSAALSLREAHRRRIRLPLPMLTIAGPGCERLRPFIDLVRDEVNVKELVLDEDASQLARPLLKVKSRVVGPKVGKDMKAVLAAAEAGSWVLQDDGRVQVGEHRLEPGVDFVLALTAVDGLKGIAIEQLPEYNAVVALDVRTTPELEREGLARDAVRLLQQLRKDLDLEINTRVDVRYMAQGEQARALEEFGDYVAEQVLAESLEASGSDGPAGGDWRSVDWPGEGKACLAIRARG